MHTYFQPYSYNEVQLADEPLKLRFELNKKYVMSLTNENLLRSFYLEAGLWSYSGNGGTTSATTTSTDGPEHWHWGWESPTCELRGHMMGHWLSAAARMYAGTGDQLVKSKADYIVAELARCQTAIGSGWLAAFPQNYMERVARGKWVWAPHYTVHKLLMGLHEMYTLAGSKQALAIMCGIGDWFYQWTGNFNQQQMDDILDMETGGMLEVWADLYGITKKEEHRELIERYDRRRFFDALLEGEDVLTNKHANTQIPEILGAAKAWEVTGNERYRKIVHAYWKTAVTERGYVATGAGDDGELWMPGGGVNRLGVGQEHCVNYNMMRLAHTLLRWTGDAAYADYWERRFINGVLAHQHNENGMISYFIGVGQGSKKNWGSPTQHFWCCHGTLVQANAGYSEQIYLQQHDEGIAIAQWLPSKLKTGLKGKAVELTIEQDGQHGIYPLNGWNVTGMKAITEVHTPPIPQHRPDEFMYTVKIGLAANMQFPLSVRIPWWAQSGVEIAVNGSVQAMPLWHEQLTAEQPTNDPAHDPALHEQLVQRRVVQETASQTKTVAAKSSLIQTAGSESGQFVTLDRMWQDGDTIVVKLPKALKAESLPGESEMYAIMDGPIVLAGLVDEERKLKGNPANPHSFLIADRERNHSWWNAGYYRTKGQARGLRFIPLYEIKEERYTVYFPISESSN